jgi:hypothetical protein
VKVQVVWDMTPAHKPEDINLYEHRCESLKPRTQSTIPLTLNFGIVKLRNEEFDLNLTFRIFCIKKGHRQPLRRHTFIMCRQHFIITVNFKCRILSTKQDMWTDIITRFLDSNNLIKNCRNMYKF